MNEVIHFMDGRLRTGEALTNVMSMKLNEEDIHYTGNLLQLFGFVVLTVI